MAVGWRIVLLGSLRAEFHAGAPRPARIVDHFPRRTTAALLAYLACHRRGLHAREELLELLWPEHPRDQGRKQLNTALSELRTALPLPPDPEGARPLPILGDGNYAVALNWEFFCTDAQEFDAALRAAGRAAGVAERIPLLVAAVPLYGGDLLPGFDNEWLRRERQFWRERWVGALYQLALDYEAVGDDGTALEWALRTAGAEPLHEPANQAVMRLFAQLGQSRRALDHFNELKKRFQKSAAPIADETRDLAKAIRNGWVRPRPTTPATAQRVVVARRGGGTLSVGANVRQLTDGGTPAASDGRTHPPDHREPVGGGSLASPLYVERAADGELRAALVQGQSILRIKGPRQVGKSSLLARGLQQARAGGARAVYTQLQKLNDADLASVDTFLRALAGQLAAQLQIEMAPDAVWTEQRGPSDNLECYLQRAVLSAAPTPFVWGLDGVDRLLSHGWRDDVFSLLRFWHEERSRAPGGSFSQLTLVLAHSMEPHYFITGPNRSPFIVGTALLLEDFTPAQVADLNMRHGAPLRDEEELARFYHLLGGHPFLSCTALQRMVADGMSIHALEAQAAGEAIFGEHLSWMHSILARDEALKQAVHAVLGGGPCPTAESFDRLRSAGILAGPSAREPRVRCQLYAASLAERLL